MTEIKIVSGLNYGDESKGLVANYISTPTSLTVMASNSCQRGHTVVEKGIRKVFRHFGTATLKGAANYFTEKFYVNPAMFRQEYEELVKLGATPIVYAKIGSIIITPMDMFATIEVERQMGDDAHSTTGTGVWQGLKRHYGSIGMTLGQKETYRNASLIKSYYLNFFKKKGELTDRAAQFYFGDYLCDNFYYDLEFFLNHVTLIHTDKEEAELLRSYSLIVFENSQGLLLDDDWNPDVDHNTPAHVGAKIPMKVIERVFSIEEVDIETLYVTRTYLTRHGKGDIYGIECTKEDINPNMIDKTNVWNEGQGSLRYGKFTKDAANDAIARLIIDGESEVVNGYWTRPGIVITHMNEYNDGLLEEAARNIGLRIYTSDNEVSFKAT